MQNPPAHVLVRMILCGGCLTLRPWLESFTIKVVHKMEHQKLLVWRPPLSFTDLIVLWCGNTIIVWYKEGLWSIGSTSGMAIKLTVLVQFHCYIYAFCIYTFFRLVSPTHILYAIFHNHKCFSNSILTFISIYRSNCSCRDWCIFAVYKYFWRHQRMIMHVHTNLCRYCFSSLFTKWCLGWCGHIRLYKRRLCWSPGQSEFIIILGRNREDWNIKTLEGRDSWLYSEYELTDCILKLEVYLSYCLYFMVTTCVHDIITGNRSVCCKC